MKKVLKWIGIILVGLFVLVMIIDANKSPEQKAAEQEAHQLERAKLAKAALEHAKQELAALPSVTAANIAKAYDENTVAADQQFKDKKFKVSGTVIEISTDFMGDPYIILSGGVNEFSEPQFSFDESQAPQLANLKKGSKVTLVCVGRGDIAKTPMSGSCSLL